MKLVLQTVLFYALIIVNSTQSTAPYFLSKYKQSQSAEFTFFTTAVSASATYNNVFQSSFSVLPIFLFGISKHIMNSPFIVEGLQLTISALSVSGYSIYNDVHISSSVIQLRIRHFAFINIPIAYPQSPTVFVAFNAFESFQAASSMRVGNGDRTLIQEKFITNDLLKISLIEGNISFSSDLQLQHNSKISYLMHGFVLQSLAAGDTGFQAALSLTLINESFIKVTYRTSNTCELILLAYQVIIVVNKNTPDLLLIDFATLTINSGINLAAMTSQSKYSYPLLKPYNFLFGLQSIKNGNSNFRSQFQFLYDSSDPHVFSIRFLNTTPNDFYFTVLIFGIKTCPSDYPIWNNQSFTQCTLCLDSSIPQITGPNQKNICIRCVQGTQFLNMTSKSCQQIVQPENEQPEESSSIGIIIAVVIVVVGIIVTVIVTYFVYQARKKSRLVSSRLERTQPTMDKIFQSADIRVE